MAAIRVASPVAAAPAAAAPSLAVRLAKSRVTPTVHTSPFDGHACITQAQAELHQLFRAGRLAAAGDGHEVVTWEALRGTVPALVSDAALLAALPSTGAHLSADRTLVLGIALGDLDEEGMGNAVTHLSFEYD